jgi:hypothetical protein
MTVDLKSLLQQRLDAAAYRPLTTPAPKAAAPAAPTPTDTKAADKGDTVSLSPQALAYLNGQPGTKKYGFTLTDGQKTKLQTILAGYKDQPVTKETFQKIQVDLRKAGLDARTLEVREQIRTFQAGGAMLSYLSGQKTPYDAVNRPATSARMTTYTDQVIADWKATVAKA